MSGLRLEVGRWDRLASDALRVRYDVFVLEQLVPESLERDEWDAECWHVVAYAADDQPVATGRLLPDGHIGRVAVDRSMRGKRVGLLIMNALIDQARSTGHTAVVLSSQVHAQPFYEKLGFTAEGDIYDDAGIDHILMRKDLFP